MITRYRFALSTDAELTKDTTLSYKLYSWLSEQIPAEYAETLHGDGETPLSQYLCYDKQKEHLYWTVSLLNETAEEHFCGILDGLERLKLRDGAQYHAELYEKKAVCAPTELLFGTNDAFQKQEVTVSFLTPTTFRQQGRYVLFPSASLIVHSLIVKWNSIIPVYSITDEDAIAMLDKGISISGYSLHSTAFYLKGVRIPAFCGRVTLKAALSEPMLEVWTPLLTLAEYSGVGIKTTLGMGGVSLCGALTHGMPAEG